MDMLTGENMKNIGIIVNKDKDKTLEYTATLVKSICLKGGNALLKPSVAQIVGNGSTGVEEDELLEKADMMVCLGGDGTFLRVARKTYKKGLPILGINLGNLGFLTEVDKNDISKAVDCILEGRYRIEERMMLEASIIKKGEPVERDVALNDVVISRGAFPRVLHLKVYIDGQFLDCFPSDGIIISSPTGSTAYSLSAGGPIIDPDTELILLTPICPHILYSRSFITKGDSALRIELDESSGYNAMVTVDGQIGFEIAAGDSIEVRKSSHTVKLVSISSRNFFGILRTKIHDRGERLRENEI
jgi:NAD+ kinase